MKRLVGFSPETDELDSSKLRHYLIGGHVADYMRYLQDSDEQKYKSHFSRFIKEGVNADSVSFVIQCSMTVSNIMTSTATFTCRLFLHVVFVFVFHVVGRYVS